MKRKFLGRLLVALLVVLTAAGDVYASAGRKTLAIVGKVTRVSDGDTIWVHADLLRYKVRLNRIDAPESNQPYGKESAAHLKSLIFGKEVRVEYETTDRYGRILGIVFLGDTDINLQMVRDGCAWHYSHFDKSPSYAAAEREAESAKRGLWATPNPVNPYHWRRGIVRWLSTPSSPMYTTTSPPESGWQFTVTSNNNVLPIAYTTTASKPANTNLAKHRAVTHENPRTLPITEPTFICLINQGIFAHPLSPHLQIPNAVTQ